MQVKRPGYKADISKEAGERAPPSLSTGQSHTENEAGRGGTPII